MLEKRIAMLSTVEQIHCFIINLLESRFHKPKPHFRLSIEKANEYFITSHFAVFLYDMSSGLACQFI